jgi:carbon-monoxide dehydrogenase iron sulfur subunit
VILEKPLLELKMGKTIVVNIQKCLACRSCEMACALAHSESKVLYEALQESPKPQHRISVQQAGEFAVPLQCRHCENAPCIAVCPTKAINRPNPDGPVLIDQDRCIGCRFCITVCPFGVININAEGTAVLKCDLCIERTKTGQQPACVEACPTKALKLADEEELAVDRRKFAARELVSLIQKNNSKEKKKENTK